jgi:hypothetical protein
MPVVGARVVSMVQGVVVPGVVVPGVVLRVMPGVMPGVAMVPGVGAMAMVSWVMVRPGAGAAVRALAMGHLEA